MPTREPASPPDDDRRGRGERTPSTPAGAIPDTATDNPSEILDPADLLAIQADDHLLDMLALRARPGAHDQALLTTEDFNPHHHDDQQLIAMLDALRADVDSEPYPELISLEAACAAVAAARGPHRRRLRLLPVAAGVSLLALAGIAVAATHAQPGGAWWKVSTVIDPSRATSIQAVHQIDLMLTSAQRALEQGRENDAAHLIAVAQPELTQIRESDGRDDLTRETANLLRAAEQTPQGQPVRTDDHGLIEGNRPPADPTRSADTDPGRRRHGQLRPPVLNEPKPTSPSATTPSTQQDQRGGPREHPRPEQPAAPSGQLAGPDRRDPRHTGAEDDQPHTPPDQQHRQDQRPQADHHHERSHQPDGDHHGASDRARGARG